MELNEIVYTELNVEVRRKFGIWYDVIPAHHHRIQGQA